MVIKTDLDIWSREVSSPTLTVIEIVSPTCTKIFEIISSCIFKSYTLSELTNTETSSWRCGGNDTSEVVADIVKDEPLVGVETTTFPAASWAADMATVAVPEPDLTVWEYV